MQVQSVIAHNNEINHLSQPPTPEMSVENSFFCLLPPGKPDPHHVPQGEEPRKRVSYRGQKGNTCTYYALKILRNNQAVPRSEQSQQRTLEKAISSHRKQMTILTSDYEDTRQLARGYCSDPNSLHVPKDFRISCLIKAVEDTQDQDSKAKILPHLRAYRDQQEIKELDQFIEMRWSQDSIKIHRSFLSQIGIPLHSTGSPKEESAILHAGVFLATKAIYGCKDATWKPDEGVDALIQQLKEKGPHLVIAKLGKSFYLTEPKKVSETIEGRNVYGWPQNSPRRQTGISHAVVLVGAKKDKMGKSYVYFLDPDDPSEPEQPNTQKVYKTSYERFFGVINNIAGLPFALRAMDKANLPFALHM